MTTLNEKAGIARLRDFLNSSDANIVLLAAMTLVSYRDNSGLPILFERARTEKVDLAINITEAICRCLKVDFDRNALKADRKKTLDALHKHWKP